MITSTIFDVDYRMGTVLARDWGLIVLRGLLGIAIGIIALVQPLATVGALVLLFAIYSVAEGIAALVSAVRAARARQKWGWLLFLGFVSLGAAAAALLMPLIAIGVFLLILAFWAIVGGGALLFAAFRLPIDHGRWWLATAGLLSLVWGILLLVEPVAGVLALTLWFGAYTLGFGIILVILGLTLRQRHRRRIG